MDKCMKANIIQIYNYKFGSVATYTYKLPYWTQGDFFTTFKSLHVPKDKSNSQYVKTVKKKRGVQKFWGFFTK